MSLNNGIAHKRGLAAGINRHMPHLFAVWLLISVLGPHQEIYKIFFQVLVIPAILVLLFSRQAGINWKDPLLVTALILTVYSSLATFVVGEGPFRDHFRAFRWGVETFFCLMAFYIWLPRVLENPFRWGRYFMLLSLLGALGGFGLLAFGLINGRLSGLGALHNPIQGSSVLLIYLAAGYSLTFLRRHSQPGSGSVWLMTASTIAVALFVLMSQSRAPIFALAVFLLFPAGRLLNRSSLIKSSVLLLAGTGLLTLILSMVYGLDRYKRMLLFRGSSHRFDIWQGYLAYPPESWLFGFGAGTAPENLQAAKVLWEPAGLPITHAHNLWLGTLVETGAIGLALLMVLAGLLARSIFALPRGDFRRTGRIMLLLLVFLLTLTGSHTLVSSIKAIWLFGWLPLLMVWFSQRHEKNLQ